MLRRRWFVQSQQVFPWNPCPAHKRMTAGTVTKRGIRALAVLLIGIRFYRTALFVARMQQGPPWSSQSSYRWRCCWTLASTASTSINIFFFVKYPAYSVNLSVILWNKPGGKFSQFSLIDSTNWQICSGQLVLFRFTPFISSYVTVWKKIPSLRINFIVALYFVYIHVPNPCRIPTRQDDHCSNTHYFYCFEGHILGRGV